jgi:hypothetical protein
MYNADILEFYVTDGQFCWNARYELKTDLTLAFKEIYIYDLTH